MTHDYDYIIAGAGCAGLSLSMHMLQSGLLADKKLLIADPSGKSSNDRTWCFWQQDKDLFEPVVHHRWSRLQMHTPTQSQQLDIQPYEYKMIRGADFYAYCLEEIRRHPQVTFSNHSVEHIVNHGDHAEATVGGNTLTAGYVFNSIFRKPSVLSVKDIWMLQHFRGWLIETEDDTFDASSAVLMDFRADQQYGTAFCYVLPLSRRQALVEYTLFTPSLLQHHQYEAALRAYIEQHMGVSKYHVRETETGVIPMTSFAFPQQEGRIVHIGTAGGQTKASTGYTFNFIQKHSRNLVRSLMAEGAVRPRRRSSRFAFYDAVLLEVLKRNSVPGPAIFAGLFGKNDVRSVFRFLDNESSLRDDMKILSSLPALPFMKAAMRHIF
ncbi:MAG TPA: lycopene cyclase family protein [Flavisolibacter sp.]